MNLETHKETAVKFFDYFTGRNFEAALNLLADDVTWQVAGQPETFFAAGYYNKERISKLFKAMMKQLKDGLKMEVRTVTAEDNRVALEVESNGELLNGRVYNQQHHFFMEFDSGKISLVREYMDTQYAQAVWFSPNNPEP